MVLPSTEPRHGGEGELDAILGEFPVR